MAFAESIVQTMDIIFLIIKWGWWLFILIYLAILKLYVYKNFPIEVIILERRGNSYIKTNDRAGRYVDPYTGIIGYKLKKAKDTIPVVDFECVLYNNRQDLGLLDKLMNKLWANAGTMFLHKYGSKQYKPVKVSDDPNSKIEWVEVTDEKGNPITVSILKPINPTDKLAGLGFEVVDWDNMNFMVQEQRASIERRKKKSEFWKQIVIPAMIIGGAVVVSIVMIKFGYDAMVAVKSTSVPQQQAQVPAADPTDPNIPIIGDMLPK